MKLYDNVKELIVNKFIPSDNFTEELLHSIESYGLNHKDVVRANYIGRCFCHRFTQVYDCCKQNKLEVSQNDLDIVLKAMTSDEEVNKAISDYIDKLYSENDIDESPVEYIRENEKIVLSSYEKESRLERFVKMGGTFVMINCIFRGTYNECKNKLKQIEWEE